MFQSLRRLALGLDPARSLGRLREYDQGRGFDAFAADCARAAPVRRADAAAEALRRDGAMLVDAMPPDAAARLRERLTVLPARAPRLGDIDYSDCFDVPADLERDMVEACLGGPAETLIEAYFGSHFHLYTYEVSRLHPGKASKRSMLWHCDSGPSKHLKMLVYLEPSSVSGGNTAFIDRESSDGFLAAGYTFGPVRRRRDDLAPLARRLRLRFEPRASEIAAGQGLLFEPARVLHRGMIPSLAPRHVASLMLLPSPKPWRDVYDARGPLAAAIGQGFPRHARDLMPLL